MTFRTKFLLFISICVPPNNPITACGVTSFPGYYSFPKWAIESKFSVLGKWQNTVQAIWYSRLYAAASSIPSIWSRPLNHSSTNDEEKVYFKIRPDLWWFSWRESVKYRKATYATTVCAEWPNYCQYHVARIRIQFFGWAVSHALWNFLFQSNSIFEMCETFTFTFCRVLNR